MLNETFDTGKAAFRSRGKQEAEQRFGCIFRPVGNSWRCKCPVHHGDSDTSFAWDPDKQVFHCFSRPGCFHGDIFDLIEKVSGQTFKETMNGTNTAPQGPAKAPHVHAVPRKEAPALIVPQGTPEPEKRDGFAGRWPYTDAAGQLLGYVDRIGKADGKIFCPWRWNGTGWEDKALPTPRPLYGLHDLALRPDAPLLVVEGEKTADAARKLFPDYVVVTSSGGASSASASDWTPLAGRNVTIWPDHDEPGAGYAQAVAAVLSGLAATVRIVTVPSDWPEKWDLADERPASYKPDDGTRLLAEAKAFELPQPAEDEWPEPEPLPEAIPAPSLYDDCGDGRPWLDAAFPASFARYIRGVARGNELSPGVVAAMSLPALALAVGPDVTARGNAGHRETLSSWCLGIEPPGNRKSKAAREATAPLAALAQRIEQDGALLRAEWNTRHARREMETASIKKAIGKHYDEKASGKQGAKPLTPFQFNELIDGLTAVNKAEIEDPMPGPFELLTTNPTPEAVVERVASLRRYGAFAAEGATILQGVAEYRDKGNSGAPVGHWCSIYSGDEVSMARKGKPALVISAGSAILCVGLTVQPSVLDRAMADQVLVGQGFLARFLKFPAGDESFVESEALPHMDEPALAWWDHTLAAIAARPVAGTAEVGCDSDAARLLRTFELEMERRSRDEADLGDNDSLRVWARKAHGLALRHAVHFHALDGKPYDERIDSSTMQTAIMLARYGLAVELAFSKGRGNSQYRRLRRLSILVANSGLDEITPRIAEKKGWAASVEEARAGLQGLRDCNLLRQESKQNPNGGPLSLVFVVNPKFRFSTLREKGGITCKTRQHPAPATSSTPDEGSYAGYAAQSSRNQNPETALPAEPELTPETAQAPPKPDQFAGFMADEPPMPAPRVFPRRGRL